MRARLHRAAHAGRLRPDRGRPRACDTHGIVLFGADFGPPRSCPPPQTALKCSGQQRLGLGSRVRAAHTKRRCVPRRARPRAALRQPARPLRKNVSQPHGGGNRPSQSRLGKLAHLCSVGHTAAVLSVLPHASAISHALRLPRHSFVARGEGVTRVRAPLAGSARQAADGRGAGLLAGVLARPRAAPDEVPLMAMAVRGAAEKFQPEEPWRCDPAGRT